tara:strand:- start:318 stop:1784 length:1467 start_codon:yes stop_codon:yes gene_type:complete
MPTNTLDLFVEERRQEIVLTSVRDYTDEFVEVPPIDLSSFTQTEFERIKILIGCNFNIEFEAFGVTRERSLLEWLRFRSPREHPDKELIIKYLKILEQNYILYCVIAEGFVLFNDTYDNDVYCVLEPDETFNGSGVRLCAEQTCCNYVWTGRYEEGYSTSEDYICYNDEYYIDSEVAEMHGIVYRDCCDEYVHEDTDYCCSYNTTGETFDSAFTDIYTREAFVDFTKTSGMKYTFGVELETSFSKDVPYTPNINMKAVYDGSTDGHEFVSGVLHGNKGIKTIREMCDYLNEHNAKVDRKCGVHVHIGGASFNRRFSIMVARLCKEIESDLYAMLPQSRNDNTYCRKLPNYVSELNFRNYRDNLGKLIMNMVIDRTYNKKKNHPGGHYNSQRYYWLNMTNYSCATGPDTIEFRNHSGTLDFNKIYNWILICMSIVKFAENQQRRIWNCGLSDKHRITLKDVLKYSLNSKDFEKVWLYVKARASRFGVKL